MPSWAKELLTQILSKKSAPSIILIFGIVAGIWIFWTAISKGLVSLPAQTLNASASPYDKIQDEKIEEAVKLKEPIEEIGETVTAIAKKMGVDRPQRPENWFNGRRRR